MIPTLNPSHRFWRRLSILAMAGWVLLPAAGEAQSWQPVTASATMPSPRQNAAGIYDRLDDRLILFGGRSSSGDLNDLWALDLEQMQWQQLSPTGNPPEPRHTHNAVFDGENRAMLVWSGRSVDGNGSRFHNDVHRLDLATLSWRLIEPSTTPPVSRYGTAAVFDASRGDLVNFAGFTDLGRFDDTWRLDIGTGTWRQVPVTESPGERCLHGAAYDPHGEQMIIFGGQRGPDALDDVWALRLQTDAWRELPSMPAGGRRFPATVFDPVGRRFLTFGGERQGTRFDDLWALSLSGSEAEWSQIGISGDGPPARDRAVVIYDDRRHRLVLFGGTGASGHLNDTWVLPLSRPTAVATESSTPSALSLRAIYPNPFNAQVHIHLQVPPGATGALDIFDLLGQRVRRIRPLAGQVQLEWDGTTPTGTPVASGVYLLRLQAAGSTVERRVALVR